MVNERTTYVVVGLVLLAGVFTILFVAGCFNNKIGASSAATILRRQEPTWKQVVCHGVGGYWDYACVVRPKSGPAFSFDLRVNGSGITDQSAP
jgi:hypothetical protein